MEAAFCKSCLVSPIRHTPPKKNTIWPSPALPTDKMGLFKCLICLLVLWCLLPYLLAAFFVVMGAFLVGATSVALLVAIDPCLALRFLALTTGPLIVAYLVLKFIALLFGGGGFTDLFRLLRRGACLMLIPGLFGLLADWRDLV